MHYLHTTLSVTDLEASAAFLENWAGLNPSPIREPAPGVRFFFLSGPDGLAVQLMQKG